VTQGIEKEVNRRIEGKDFSTVRKKKKEENLI